ncbi:MAG: RNA polymerase sporulation sigma factor SigG [Clostridia bacterium]|nr:RNA polymerase sporulation sigma factor SigG [Clostridia bacterium]
MAKRVEICGIDTGSLPKLSHEEMMNLLKKAQNGDKYAKDQFVIANVRLVLSVVQRFYNKKESIDDIFQVGCIGLIKAMENFNTELNLRFSTYAVPMIIGEIRRFLRDSSPVRISRSVRDTAYKAINVRQSIEKKYNREATMEEIASALDIPLCDLAYAMDAISDPVSLYDPVYHDGDETVLLMDQISDERNSDEKWLTSVTLKNAIDSLSEREREILMLRYYEGKTQMEISEEIGISQAQVSRLEKSAKTTLKKNIS